MTKATDDANAEGKRIVDEARKTADVLTAKRKEALQADAKSLDRRDHSADAGGSVCDRTQDAR